MLFGCCTSIDNSQILADAGGDYLECTLISLLPEEDETEFAPVRAKIEISPVPVMAANVFLPADLKVVGPNVDWARAERYVHVALTRAGEVGVKIVVFGSGRSRSVPKDFPREEAHRQLVRFLGVAAEKAEAEGITIAIEPLNSKESNIINSIAEGAELARRVGHPSVRGLADFYHMEEDREPLSAIQENGPMLAHIHVADTNRGAPGTGSYPYPEFAAELRKTGYDGMISIECRWQDFAAECAPALSFLREVFAH